MIDPCPFSLISLLEGGLNKFFSEVINFKEGKGNFTLDFVPLLTSVGSGSILLVLHFDSYLGRGRLALSCLRLGGNLMV